MQTFLSANPTVQTQDFFQWQGSQHRIDIRVLFSLSHELVGIFTCQHSRTVPLLISFNEHKAQEKKDTKATPTLALTQPSAFDFKYHKDTLSLETVHLNFAVFLGKGQNLYSAVLWKTLQITLVGSKDYHYFYPACAAELVFTMTLNWHRKWNYSLPTNFSDAI